MKTKPLWKFSVVTTLEAEDAISELLGGIFGQPASSFFDIEKQASIVSIYFSERQFLSREVRKKILEGLKRIKNCRINVGSGKITLLKVWPEDWAESWKRHFKPIEIGNSLLIKPSWSKRRPRKNQTLVILDPGLSFGTGQHPTTAFCLGELARHKKWERDLCPIGGRGVRQNTRVRACSPFSFLDIGTGSGILAIAAAKLGYKPVRAFDFDSEAVRVARANARMNGVLNQLQMARGDVTELPTKPKKRFDLICANLISNLLIAERKRIVAQLNCDGILVLAGILKSEFLKVKKQFEALGLKLVFSRSENEWRSGSFCFI
ncbi:MAG: 50S ribosomal protein L11 methyltransferase [Limisphaerales bacterium]